MSSKDPLHFIWRCLKEKWISGSWLVVTENSILRATIANGRLWSAINRLRSVLTVVPADR
jgi:hypothetical protein